MTYRKTIYALGCAVLLSLSACKRPGQSTAESTSGDELLKDGFYGEPATDQQQADEVIKSDEDIVASMEFSTIEDSQTAPTNEPVPENACDGQHAESNDLPVISSQQACERIANRLASVSLEDCEQAKLSLSNCKSIEQFPILVREFAPLPNREPQGRILVIGGTHGDELTSVSIIFRWIEKLNLHHSGMFHWRIAPMINPDGVLRKAASRTNQRGVDLNRNLPSDDWNQNALRYWEEKSGKNKRRYPGPHAASEPETQWLVDEIDTFKPDAIISVHAPFGVVDYDALVLKTAPKNLGKLVLNLLGTYPGSLGNYAGINRNIPVITLELPHAWVMPSETETAKIWSDIVSWLRKNIN
ncbi:MAG: succinylglutamate desuccinylase/aspartoacylase family protein, partial [Arenicella sp.]|nr:succinylglutamate desuccinylase/aspartoacylase family protein [Arenicella sp.]